MNKFLRKGGSRHLALLMLLFLTAYFPASSQVVLIDGTLYEKVNLTDKIESGDNRVSLYDGLYNGENDCYKAALSGTGQYSYLNINLGTDITGKILVKYDTYETHIPKDVEFRIGNNIEAGSPVYGSSDVMHRANTPYKFVFTEIPEYVNPNENISIQMRASSEAGREFMLREFEVLTEYKWTEPQEGFVPYNLYDRLGSNNNGNNFDNLLNVAGEWGIDWQIDGVVKGEYASVKIDLNATDIPYVLLQYTNGVRQAPTRVSFYGYDGDDWNTKDPETLNINTRWKQLDFVYVDDANVNPEEINEWQQDLYGLPDGANEPNKTRNVIIKLDTPYQYVMMRVYDTSGNPGSGYNGHIAGNIVAEGDRIDNIDYVSNFDLAQLKVSRWLTEEQIGKYEITNLADINFIPTHGVVDPENKDVWGYGNTNVTEGNWTDQTITEIAARYGVSISDFKRSDDNVRQAAHEKEYDVYVIPGETVALIPYSDIGENGTFYFDGYSRWYDYASGKAIPEKYFGYEYNPVQAWQTANGLFGSRDVINRLRNLAGMPQLIGWMDKYRGAITQFHVPEGEDFNGYKVAADFTTAVDGGNWQEKAANMVRVNDGNITIVEPPVTFRAVFNIKDGRKFADNLTDNNASYILENRKVVSAASGKIFRIRLDFPEPKEENVHSDIYYKKGDGTYDRVFKFDVRTFDSNGNRVDDLFKTDNGRHDRNGFKEVSLPRMGFISEQAGKEFNRFLKCEYGDAVGGKKYIVKIFGKDNEGNTIKDSSGNDLQIMEYEVTFENSGVDVSMQSMTDYLTNLDDNAANDLLPRHTSQSLKRRFGDPYSKQDFDQYTALAFSGVDEKTYFTLKESNDEESNAGPVSFVTKMGRAISYPFDWDRADYAFSYTTNNGWNVYDICNHSEMTSYSYGASNRNSRGLFDVSFYFNNPTLYGDTYNDSTVSVKNPKFDYSTHTYNDAGYFFFVDAACDPGRIYRTEISRPCPGTRIHVSAWVSEFGNSNADPEEAQEGVDATGNWANVIFHFRKQLPDGTIKTLYSYLPGKVPSFGEWYHIYFSFSPNVSDFENEEEGTKYYVALESNCPSSWGADYAVDDIEIFLQKPDVTLLQEVPICTPAKSDESDDKDNDVRIRVEMPFDIMMTSAGLNAGEDAYLYFALLDKDKYEEEKSKDETVESAFNNSIIKVDNNDYGKVKITSVDYDKLPEFTTISNELKDLVAMRSINEFGEKCITFLMTVSGEAVKVGKDLEVSVVVDPDDVGSSDLSVDGLMTELCEEGDCAIRTDLTLMGAAIVKLDGIVQPSRYDITCCENQRPVVQLIMQKKDGEGNIVESTDHSDEYYDWFNGTYDDFVALGLEDALGKFRLEYPDAETYDMPIKGAYTQDDYDLLKEYCNPVEAPETADNTEEGKGRDALLHLHQSFYIFPEYHLEKDEEEHTFYVTAKPIDKNEDPEVMLCMNPVQIPLTVRNAAPVMLHGLRNLPYPETIKDVPLRVGLNQIRNAQVDFSLDNIDFDKLEVAPAKLWLPVRSIEPVTDGVKTLVKSEVEKAAYVRLPDQYVYLAGSNDPNYKSLNPPAAEVGGNATDMGDEGSESSEEFDGLVEVGRIVDIIANKEEETGNFVSMVFDSNFKPREGYYYKLRYSFEENRKEWSGSDYIGDEEPPCYGEDVLTIKIVPEYQMWIGAKDGDFNNDANWRRVSSEELLVSEGTDLSKLKLTDFVTDGNDGNDDSETNADAVSNANKASYVPMDFTKVIVPEVKNSDDATTEAVALNVLKIENISTENVVIAPKDATLETNEQVWVSGYKDDDDIEGVIKYDMAAFLDAGNNVQCKAWYHNTCEEIHFNFGAEFINPVRDLSSPDYFNIARVNQGALNYKRAWIDVDNKPGSWYFLSMPLQKTFAGDFYLPTKTKARQQSQLFTDINFLHDGTNDRFKPAVYQRAWNKGTAQVYDIHDGHQDSGDDAGDRNVAVTANWSRVYNDVKEEYSTAFNPGFSVKTDVSYMDEAQNIDNVRYRFPKADKSYDYWSQDGNTSGHTTTMNRYDESDKNKSVNLSHRLNPSEGTMTARVAQGRNNDEGPKYFLVGNPFMCHLDLKTFFDANNDKINGRCWIMYNGALKAIDGDMFGDESEPSDWRYLPPFQGFFVETIDNTTAKKNNEGEYELTLEYDAGMMAALTGDNIISIAARKDHTDENTVLLTMSAAGEQDSQVRFVLGDNADSSDVPAIFNASGESSLTAYGVSDGLATSIRHLSHINKEEIGVAVKDNKLVTLRFNGVALDGLKLQDKLTGTETDLYDGMEYQVEGCVAGRLFLVSSTGAVEGIAISGFSLDVDGHNVTITAPEGTESVAMQVFDIAGRTVLNSISESQSATATLATGVYVVKAVTDLGANYSAKIIIK